MSDPNDYTIGFICALTIESVAARLLLDETHVGPAAKDTRDTNAYRFGKIQAHYVVIATLPMGEYGTASAADVAVHMLRSFPNIRVGLMVGIGGGAPSSRHDIRLGDVVIGVPTAGQSGVFQYDFGKSIQGQSFQATRTLNQPPPALLAAVAALQSDHMLEGNGLEDAILTALRKNRRLEKKFSRPPQSKDILFKSSFTHAHDSDSCNSCAIDTANIISRADRTEHDSGIWTHYGTIASANTLMKDAKMRDLLASQKDILCFEMEAAGLVNRFPCLIIRGICDYSDSHKNKEWQPFAAMAAGSYAKQIIKSMRPEIINREKTINDQLSEVSSRVAAIQQDVKHIKRAKQGTEILDWLSNMDFRAQQTDVIDKWQPGTGHWLLDSDKFQNWVRQKSLILFCPGIPGSGKTTLTSVVIQHLTEQFREDFHIGIAYVYCHFRRQGDQQTKNILADILKQLCQRQATVPQVLETMYNEHGHGATGLRFNEIREALLAVGKAYAQVFVIIDALDEWQVSEQERSNLVDELFRLQREMGFNLFATSRPIPAIQRKFDPYPRLTISASHDDICRFIDNYPRPLPHFLTGDPVLKETVKISVSHAAQGM
ncbi:related to ankyrin [Fusarium oxysporum]|uniref:Related to ankyrin n=1 Tax=Fusarium oxysporum TaxID=5507 RepID=A0A2H3TYF4_FUSOX|nr:related to ankyrin [Fusarium oxysporum]